MSIVWNELLQPVMGGLSWVGQQILFQVPIEQNLFWMVTAMTAIIMVLEQYFPWRKNQRFFRKDWGVDLFYLYANIFIFAVIIKPVYDALSYLLPNNLHAPILSELSWGWQLVVFFIVQDFLQWGMHRLLHRNNWLWKFHQIHHSVKEMGVASHFRYHWMENIVYKPTKLATLALFAGVEPQMAVLVHMGSLLIGHLNHANLNLDWGPLRYIFNSPTMHLLHHSQAHLTQGGVNFGISLSCWDYMFGTVVQPTQDGDLILGFEGDDMVPSSVLKQFRYPLR